MSSRVGWLVAVSVLVSSACGGADPAGDGTDDCVPATPDSVAATGDPDRRIEDIVEYLTGERQTDDVPVEGKIDDPDFGGVWGDRRGGVVVAVLDCSLVDADRLAEMAGGSGSLHLIEVPYTFRQVDGFRDRLTQELGEIGVEGDVLIDSTTEGRTIRVVVEDPGSLPDSFGSGVPADLFEVVKGPISGEE